MGPGSDHLNVWGYMGLYSIWRALSLQISLDGLENKA